MNDDIEFNLGKYKAVIHYIISKCGFKDNVGRTVLYKLLYFSDFILLPGDQIQNQSWYTVRLSALL